MDEIGAVSGSAIDMKLDDLNVLISQNNEYMKLIIVIILCIFIIWFFFRDLDK